MGQAAHSAIRVERAGLAQLVVALKCLELAHKVQQFFSPLELLVRSASSLESR